MTVKEDIIRGQTSNQAIQIAVGTEKETKDLDEFLNCYERIYTRLLPINLKLLNGDVGTTENEPIPEENIQVGHSTTVPEKKPVNPNAYNDNNVANDQNNEIGAAWNGKYPGTLSCKSKIGEDRYVKTANLEKTDEGYREEIEGNIYIYKKLSKEERPNPKMPHYRVYKDKEE